MEPYEGNDNYIFISYAHRDSSQVIPLIQAMMYGKYRVWYDSGIEAGTEWPAYIEDHLNRCSAVVVFMTNAVVQSKNCRNEINLALHLEKPILLVYLEQVNLAQGMNLQLNSTQSLYLYQQPSYNHFVNELLKARLLQHCKTTSFVGSTKTDPHQAKSQGSLISNVCSIPSNDAQDAWPKGNYTSSIDRDQFQVIYFHTNLMYKITRDCTVSVRLRIYNQKNLLIHDNETEFPVKAGYDRFSSGWIIRGDDGSFIPSGRYRAEVQVNHSVPFTYSFEIYSSRERAYHPPKDESQTDHSKPVRDNLEGQRKKLLDKLSRPQGAGFFLGILLCLSLTLPGNEIDIEVLPYLGLIGACVFSGCLVQYTKRHVTNNWLLAVLLVLVGNVLYGGYLVISALIVLCTQEKIKQEIANLSSIQL